MARSRHMRLRFTQRTFRLLRLPSPRYDQPKKPLLSNLVHPLRSRSCHPAVLDYPYTRASPLWALHQWSGISRWARSIPPPTRPRQASLRCHNRSAPLYWCHLILSHPFSHALDPPRPFHSALRTSNDSRAQDSRSSERSLAVTKLSSRSYMRSSGPSVMGTLLERRSLCERLRLQGRWSDDPPRLQLRKPGKYGGLAWDRLSYPNHRRPTTAVNYPFYPGIKKLTGTV